jgi:hypothetical protein
MFSAKQNQNNLDKDSLEQLNLEKCRAFMEGYVARINAATFNVTIGGVRIGKAKRSRLAQINLKSRIITFSRYAIENVPERGRRYLVIHELAHVKEPSHNKNFWQLVGTYEPDYKRIEKDLEDSFRLNVKSSGRRRHVLGVLGSAAEKMPSKIIAPGAVEPNVIREQMADAAPSLDFEPVPASEDFSCFDEVDLFDDLQSGIACGSDFHQLHLDRL